jgi:phosphodiesterase/alkaline phosphatase D-like protein
MLLIACPTLAATPTVSVQNASQVSPDFSWRSAQVSGTINPGNEKTTYRFQYATESNFADAIDGPEGSVEPRKLENELAVEGELTNLELGTTYYLRLIATNASGQAEATAAKTFTTASETNGDPLIGEISGPSLGADFGNLGHQSVAVNGKDNHILVADSSDGLVYDFSSVSDQSPEIWNGSNTPNGSFGNAGVAVAADDSTGDVYVDDVTNGIIDKFDEDGNLLTSFGDNGPDGQLVGSATPAGSFSRPAGLAVDQQNGDLYVLDTVHEVIDVFSPSGEYLSQIVKVVHELNGIHFLFSSLAVDDSSGDVYSGQDSFEEVEQFSAAGDPIRAVGYFPDSNVAVATDSETGRLYVLDTDNHAVQVFNTSGSLIEKITGLSTGGPNGTGGDVSLGEASKSLWVTSARGLVSEYLLQGVELPEARTKRAENVTYSTATLPGFVNPDETDTSYRFEWGRTDNYESRSASIPVGSDDVEHEVSLPVTGLATNTIYHYRLVASTECESGTQCASASPDRTFKTAASFSQLLAGEASPVSKSAATIIGTLNPSGFPVEECVFEFGQSESYGEEIPCEESSSQIGSGAEAVHVQARVEGLSVNTAYHYRLRAKNSTGPAEKSSDSTFRTSGAPVVASTSFNDVGYNELNLEAEIDPGGASTTYHFEYGLTESYGDSTVTEELAGSDRSDHLANGHLDGLEPGTIYHFRVVATNEVESVAGPDRAFRTYSAPAGGAGGCPNEAFRTGLSAGLPDCRAYELVSAGETGDSEVYVPTALNMGTDFNNGLNTRDPFQVAPPGDSIAYVGDPAPTGGNGGGGNGLGVQFLATRAPGGGWSTVDISAPRREAHYQGFSTDLSLGVLSAGFPNLEETPLSADAPGGGHPVLYSRFSGESAYDPLYREPIHFTRTAEEFGSKGRRSGDATFAGAAADATNLFFEADDSLLGPEAPLAGELRADVEHEVAQHESHDYLYDSVAGSLSLIDVSLQGKVLPNADFGGSEAGGEEADFSNAISTDGRRVYWTDLANGRIYLRLNPAQPQSEIEAGQCTEAAKACTLAVSVGSATYQAASADGRYAFYAESGRLFRYDAQGEESEALTPAGAQVQGVLGASEAGGAVYFAADGVLPHEPNPAGLEPSAGQPNLYRWSGGATSFIATLAAADGEEEEPMWGAEAGTNPPYSGGYGDWYPWLASRTARVTGDGGGLVFMSTRPLPAVGHPEGYPNEGAAEVYLYQAASGKLFCASCAPSDAAPAGSSYLPPSLSDTYLPQWISEDGDRVFFDSPDALVPTDTNNAQDVYEWEREGSGSCGASEAVDGGCILLLSTGASPDDSWLIGASADGSDAFIVSRAQLSPEDGNEKMDLYDARVDAEPAHPEVICEGREECQRPEPQVPPYTSPPTASFHGPADPSGKGCGQGSVARQGKCVKKKPKKHHHKAKHGRKGKKSNKRANSDHGGAK